MKLPLLKKLQALRPRERTLVGRFADDGELRGKVVKEFQRRGIGVGVSQDSVAAWLELILKYLPQFLSIILSFIK